VRIVRVSIGSRSLDSRPSLLHASSFSNERIMNTELMHHALEGSQQGRLTFPEVVGMLISAGVESYRCDLLRADDTFYMTNGQTHVEKMSLPAVQIPAELSASGIIAAIRAAQADEIRYPEFLNRAIAAGVVSYWVFISGKKVIYFGRKGDFHVEEFPRPKS
jgi:uncharacterized protein YbcV (DUF1398 family)